MSKDNIIEFKPKEVNTDEGPMPIIQCNDCGNLTWIVDPEGTIHCAICHVAHELSSFVLGYDK